MVTLRSIVETQKQHTQEEWIEIAAHVDINDLDEEITTDALLRLRAYEQTWKHEAEEKARAKAAEEEAQRRAEEAKAVQMLDKLVREKYIFIDPSSLMVPTAKEAFERMTPILREAEKKIFITEAAVDALMRDANDSGNEEKNASAIQGVEILQALNQERLLSVRRMPDAEKFADYGLSVMCNKFRVDFPLLVITQNEQLAREILKLNNQRSVSGPSIVTKKINKYGYISNVIDNPQPFRISKVVRNEEDEAIPVSVIPDCGDSVYDVSHSGAITLTEELSKGKEGKIYRTNTPYIAKVYYSAACTKHRFEKIEKMIQAGLYQEGICFPIAMLYNENREPIGYLMPEAKGATVEFCIFKANNLVKMFPNWTKKDLVHTIISILKKIEYVQSQGILLGDVNPRNIMVESPDKVYLVDTDSYQIDDLPCAVGFPTYTAPEILQKLRDGVVHGYSELIRTKKEEDFAVSTLVFMMLMYGKTPYAQVGGESPIDNILSLHFPYAVGDRRGEGVPQGDWRFVWSHMTRRMKENFLKVFNKEDGNSEFNSNERLSVKQWIQELERYENVLLSWEEELAKDPFSLKCDPMSLELFPDRLKHETDAQYMLCKGGCGREYKVTDPDLKAGYCPECQRKGETVKCWYDGKEFTFTNYDRYYKQLKEAPILCPECRKDKSIVYRKECEVPGCTNQIEFTRWQIAMAKKKAAEKGYEFAFPKICKPCKENGKKLSSSNGKKTTVASSEKTQQQKTSTAAPKARVEHQKNSVEKEKASFLDKLFKRYK